MCASKSEFININKSSIRNNRSMLSGQTKFRRNNEKKAQEWKNLLLHQNINNFKTLSNVRSF